MPTAEAQRVSKKKLTVAEAADQWETSKREMDRLKPLLEEAAEVMKDHFDRTGRTTYKDRIALVTTPGKLILDQAAIRVYLGGKLADFQKRTSPSKSLSLLR